MNINLEGYRLRVMITSVLAITIATYLTFFAQVPGFPSNDGHPPSWSQNATYRLWSVLNVLLLSIAYVFGELASNFELRDTVVYKWFGTEIRFEHLSRGTQFGFFAILIFHLGSEIFPDWMHMVSTGIGIAYMGLLVLGWYGTWSSGWWAFTSSLVASTILLLLGFVFKLTDVGYGEFALALVGISFIFNILKTVKKTS